MLHFIALSLNTKTYCDILRTQELYFVTRKNVVRHFLDFIKTNKSILIKEHFSKTLIKGRK